MVVDKRILKFLKKEKIVGNYFYNVRQFVGMSYSSTYFSILSRKQTVEGREFWGKKYISFQKFCS